MLVRIFVLFVFCFKVFADAELDLAKKYFTEEEINEFLKWEFDFGSGRNSYKTEPIKFYANKELTGEVFAEIDDKGLKIGSSYICNYVPYSDEYVLLAQKYEVFGKRLEELGLFRRFLESQNSTKKSKLNIYERQMKTCDVFPVLITNPPGFISIKLKLRVYDEKIGSLKMKGQDVFFDVSTWLKKYFHKADAYTILREKLTSKEYEDFDKLIHELRTVIEKGSPEEIYNFVYERSRKGHHYEVFTVETKEEFLKKKISESLRVEMLKSTFVWYRDSPGEIVDRFWNEKNIRLEPKNKVLFIRISIENGRMFFSNFGLNDYNQR